MNPVRIGALKTLAICGAALGLSVAAPSMAQVYKGDSGYALRNDRQALEQMSRARAAMERGDTYAALAATERAETNLLDAQSAGNFVAQHALDVVRTARSEMRVDHQLEAMSALDQAIEVLRAG